MDAYARITMADATSSQSFGNGFGRFLTMIGRGMNRFGAAVMVNQSSYQRLAEVERLQAMSDEDLAKRGLKRADIVRHVFHDLLYI